MRHETHPSVTSRVDHDTSLDDELDRQHEQQHDSRRRRNFLMGGGAVFLAAATAAGVLFFGGSGKEVEKTEPRHEPGTSAPAHPNASATGEAAPTPTEVAPGNWDAATVPLYADIDGDGKVETYTGQEALAQAFELRVDDYADPDDAAAAFVERVNTLLNWGNDRTVDQTYIKANVQSSNGEWGGTAAIREDYVVPAFNEALFGTPDGIDVVNDQREAWMATQLDLARQTGSRWAQSDENQYPYFLKYEVDESKSGVAHLGGEEAKGYYQYWVDVKTVDNTEKADLPPELGAAPVEGETTWSVALQQQGETWKVVGVGFK